MNEENSLNGGLNAVVASKRGSDAWNWPQNYIIYLQALCSMGELNIAMTICADAVRRYILMVSFHRLFILSIVMNVDQTSNENK